MNLKKTIAGFLSFAFLAGRAKPVAAAATVVVSKQSRPTGAEPAANTGAPASKKSAPVTRVVGAIADDEAEMSGASATAKARERERARCAAILASAGAARNPVLACSLAFATSMTRSEAIRTLEAMPEPANQAPTSRNPNIGSGGNSRVPTSQAQAGWARVLKQATTR